MEPLNVRRAGLPDLDTVLGFMGPFNQAEGIDPGPGLDAALRHLLGHEDLGTVLLAEVAGRAVGYAVLTWGYDLEWAGRDAFLTELWLDPDSRGHGRGRQLLAAVEAAAAGAGAKALHLMVRHENLVAIHLYEAMGYEEPPRRFLTKVLGA